MSSGERGMNGHWRDMPLVEMMRDPRYSDPLQRDQEFVMVVKEKMSSEQIRALKAENARLREALEFYADERNWAEGTFCVAVEVGTIEREIIFDDYDIDTGKYIGVGSRIELEQYPIQTQDRGDIARAALEKS